MVLNFEARKNVMANVKFGRPVPPVPRVLYFTDLDTNESFRNTSGRGAIYRKVFAGRTADPTWYMLEEATGRLWTPTESPVERVSVEVNIAVPKPGIY